jgi:hypothetical protein
VAYQKDQILLKFQFKIYLLGGRGVAKYPEDAVTKINEAIGDKQWECETEYFAFRW